jgi:tetratricopeptide (TPR) repeat protein
LEHALAFPGLPELRALALHHAGWMAFLQGRNDEAEALLAEGMRLASELDDTRLFARQLLTLAGVVSDRDEEEAQRLYDELAALVERHPEERFAAAFLNLADFAIQRGDYESATDFSSRSIDLYREEGDPWGLAMAIANHGLAVLGLGRTREALEDFRDALRRLESVQDTQGVALALATIAAAMTDQGETARAVRLLASAELIVEDTEAELTGFEAVLHERTLGRVRAECADFDAEWSRGRAMTREQAIAEALGDTAGAVLEATEREG